MNHNKKAIPGIVVLCVVWLALSVTAWVKPAAETSDSERRKLDQLPPLTAQTVLSGSFMTDFEGYTQDQFPARDTFRTLKSIACFYLFGQRDNNDIYLADGYAAKLEYPMSESSVQSAGDKLQKLYDKYLAGTDAKVYLSVVPDKSYFLAEANGYPAMDYERLFALMQEKTPFAQFIPIADCLQLSDYYRTDTHWRQECLQPVAQRIAQAMGMLPALSGHYTELATDVPFYGVYYGQSALPLPSETIRYLTSDTLESCIVTNAETGKIGGIYDWDKLHSRDPYEFFLSGASPILTIENPNAKTDRELVVFRDSFGSSLTPLLAEGYAKVTLIDTRYIVPDYIGQFVTFTNQDVLFLYSTLILNSSAVLK